MKIVTSIFIAFLSLNAVSQNTIETDIFDSVNVKYNSYDSCYYLINYNLEDWNVYYDKKARDIAMSVRLRNDTCYFTNFYKNGNKKRKLIVSDYSTTRKEVLEEWWYKNGQLLVSVNFNEFPRRIVNYYSNGNRKMDFITDDYDFIGLYRDWYQNGNLKSHGNYKEQTKDGVWLYFKKTGELENIEEYDNGKLIKTDEEIKE